jgi:hypothetical protein
MKTAIAACVSVAALSLTALLPSTTSTAQEGYTWHYRPHTRAYYEPHKPRYAQRVYSSRRKYHNHDHDYERDYDRAPDCKPPLSRAGTEAFDEDNAKQRADLAWQEEVRFLWGERYMDVSHARRVAYECSRSSTNESWIGKAGERIAGDAAVKKRCRITAQPCRPGKERDKKDKDD